ncbi:hypothetical protein EVAR_74828_1 [Eumeta japonica]|uniref:Uncharacterized protein n=1 Tax=Eumeta variegata TaxID=151549 RepID=A0A4C1SRX2_EUMVA|nr:hypothetical protein EVAR_74828_1 [Eumeta japonica]
MTHIIQRSTPLDYEQVVCENFFPVEFGKTLCNLFGRFQALRCSSKSMYIYTYSISRTYGVCIRGGMRREGGGGRYRFALNSRAMDFFCVPFPAARRANGYP